MTREERTIATATLEAGHRENHEQIVFAVATRLDLEPRHMEAVLHRLRMRQVLACVSATRSRGENPSVRYERGMEWTDKE